MGQHTHCMASLKLAGCAILSEILFGTTYLLCVIIVFCVMCHMYKAEMLIGSTHRFHIVIGEVHRCGETYVVYNWNLETHVAHNLHVSVNQ